MSWRCTKLSTSVSTKERVNGKIIMTHPGVIDVAAVIDSHPFGRFQTRVVAACFLLMTLDSINLSTIAYAAPTIAADWGVSVSSFGSIFAAGMIGIMIGALVFGSAADYVGRRLMVISGVSIFGVLTLLTVTAHSFQTLLIDRLLTGIGLGAVIPNIIAMTSEYAPAGRRTMLISIMSCGLPMGGLLIGIFAVPMIPAFGWKSVFYLGGLVPILLVPLLIRQLPESIRFLALKKTDRSQLANVLRQIAPDVPITENDEFLIREEKIHTSPVKDLFTDGRLRNTLLLWSAFFANLLMLFVFNNWLPSVLRKSGIPLAGAIAATTLFFLGGTIGGLLLAWLTGRAAPHRVVGYGFIGAAVATAALGMSQGSAVNMMIAVFFAGLCVIGTQININVIAAAIYPTGIRSTGLGWALGIGRIGSIVGPIAGGVLLSRGISVASLFLLMAIPGLVAAAAVFQLDHKQGRNSGMARAEQTRA
jgi:AAHS family 4-hydroxybenzoate transporter-like MFS transporter